MRKILYILSLLMIGHAFLWAQYVPVFSQYVNNMFLLNPAYAGSRDVLSASILYRDQWVGIDGAPASGALSVNSPLRNERIGVGLILLNEKIGPTMQTQCYGNYSYRVINGENKLLLGIRAGIQYYSSNLKDIQTNIPDPVFSGVINYILPDFGLGLYFFNKNYFISASIPYLLTVTGSNSGNGYKAINDATDYNYLISGGVSFKTEYITFKPSLLLQYKPQTPAQIDLTLLGYMFNEKIGFGFTYRSQDAIVLMAEVQVNPMICIGYSYDYPVGNLSVYSSGSHELYLRYELNYKVKGFNPRFF